LSRRRAASLLAAAVAVAVPLGKETVRAQGPSSARAALVTALEFVRADDCKSAEPLLLQVISTQPWNVAARRLLGRCLLDAGRWDEARPQFEALLQLAPEDASALAGLRAAVAAGQKIESARQVEQIESRRTRAEQLRAQYEMRDAEQMMTEGRHADAERALLAIIAKRPEEISAAVRLAEIYSSTGRFVEAAQLFEKLSEGPDASSTHLLRAAQNYEWSGDDATAAATYARFLEKEKGDRAARTALGRVLVRLGRCGEAVNELSAVVGATGARAGTPAVALDLARCYDRLKRADLALATYESVTRLDPKNAEAQRIVTQRRRDAEQAPLRRGYAALDAKDNETAAKELSAYLEAHPEDAEVRLQLARVYSWSSRFEPSAAAYEQYLKARPDDATARRERAQVLAWRGLTGESIREYQALAAKAQPPGQAIEDLGSILRLQVQAGDLDGARSTAERLVQLQPGHEAASQVLAQAAQRHRTVATEAAQALTAQGRYPEAIEAYRRYQEEYGADPATGLLVARLHSWGKDYPGAITSYREYLATRPEDDVARAELAAVLTWAQRTAEAEQEYRAILDRNPDDVTATLRLAQISDQRGDDPVRVLKSYEGILQRDPKSDEAQKRAHELRGQVAPRPRLLADVFTDSDDLERVSSVMEIDFTRAGRIAVTPLVGYLRAEQNRVIPGRYAALDALNAEIASRGGRVEGGGGGLRLSAAPKGWRLAAEAMVFHFDTDRTSINGRAEGSLDRGPAKAGFGLQYIRREAVYDLASGATLIAGIMGDSVLASAWVPLGPLKADGSPRFRAWVAGGSSFYSADTSGSFTSNRQDRLAARLSWQIATTVSLAYVLRHSRFTDRSPLYYSPGRDTVHLLSGAVATHGNAFKATLLVEAGHESIDGESVTPFLVQPGIEWRIRPRLPLRLSYRYGQSGNSAFGSSSYSSQGFEFSLGVPR
jgi:tetratricopeptide (TPR) repeat protein